MPHTAGAGPRGCLTQQVLGLKDASQGCGRLCTSNNAKDTDLCNRNHEVQEVRDLGQECGGFGMLVGCLKNRVWHEGRVGT